MKLKKKKTTETFLIIRDDLTTTTISNVCDVCVCVYDSRVGATLNFHIILCCCWLFDKCSNIKIFRLRLVEFMERWTQLAICDHAVDRYNFHYTCKCRTVGRLIRNVYTVRFFFISHVNFTRFLFLYISFISFVSKLQPTTEKKITQFFFIVFLDCN